MNPCLAGHLQRDADAILCAVHVCLQSTSSAPGAVSIDYPRSTAWGWKPTDLSRLSRKETGATLRSDGLGGRW
jgi:hypothetical protein